MLRYIYTNVKSSDPKVPTRKSPFFWPPLSLYDTGIGAIRVAGETPQSSVVIRHGHTTGAAGDEATQATQQNSRRQERMTTGTVVSNLLVVGSHFPPS
jgi:hypothetical protein